MIFIMFFHIKALYICNTNLKHKDMKTMYTNSGEKVQVTEDSRNLGHGKQVKVIYSDDSEGWEYLDDLHE